MRGAGYLSQFVTFFRLIEFLLSFNVYMLMSFKYCFYYICSRPIVSKLCSFLVIGAIEMS